MREQEIVGEMSEAQFKKIPPCASESQEQKLWEDAFSSSDLFAAAARLLYYALVKFGRSMEP